jgi:hypothetical protein
MKKIIVSVAGSLFLVANCALGSVAFSDNFDLYSNGNLAGTTQDELGQGTWRQDNVSAATPVQVVNGKVVLGTSGQDVYSPLASSISIMDGSSFFIGATINLTAAQSAGDYFLHWSTPAGSTTTFFSRIFARSSGAGFQLGYVVTSGGGVTAYGTDVLDFNTDYRIVLAYNSVVGPINDTFSLYVDPTDTSVEGNNTAYLTGDYASSTTAEQTSVDAINLRQGSAANAASVIIDDLNVATSFGETAVFTAVPEPSSIALATLGGMFLLTMVRRRS